MDVSRIDEAIARALASHKIELIDRKLTGLAAMRNALAGLVQQCDRKPYEGLPDHRGARAG